MGNQVDRSSTCFVDSGTFPFLSATPYIGYLSGSEKADLSVAYPSFSCQACATPYTRYSHRHCDDGGQRRASVSML